MSNEPTQGTAHHVLTWEDGGLVTVDLTDDRQVLLVIPDADLAARVGFVIQSAAGGGAVRVVEIDAPEDGIATALELLLEMAGSGPVTPAFPGDPLYETLLAQLS